MVLVAVARHKAFFIAFEYKLLSEVFNVLLGNSDLDAPLSLEYLTHDLQRLHPRRPERPRHDGRGGFDKSAPAVIADFVRSG
jgi:hypothetical protein